MMSQPGTNRHGAANSEPAASIQTRSRTVTLNEAAWRLGQTLPDAIQQHYPAVPRCPMTMAQLGNELKKVLPNPSSRLEAKFRVHQAQFVRISELLQLSDKGAWSLRPRIFSILWMIDRTDLMEEIARENLSDMSLPFTENNLPYALREVESRDRFLEAQSLLNYDAAAIEQWGSGSHTTFLRSGDADDYYLSMGSLGAGSFGHVDRVVSRLSWKEYARKRIPRGHTFKQDQQKIEQFKNELNLLQKLDHRHLVKLVGSYSDPDWVSLIMWPVADRDLAAFLQDTATGELDSSLRSFFGCLANAVAYLHENKVRHKDIKPANILVKGLEVRITDFGIAGEWSEDDGSMTDNPKQVRTPWYASPEVMDHLKRSKPSDIWSLGCVFLEMATVLCRRSLSEMRNFFENHGTESTYSMALNLDAISSWIAELREVADESNNDLLAIIARMLDQNPSRRPTARAVFEELVSIDGPLPFYGVCCDSSRVNNTVRPTPPAEFREESAKNIQSLQSLLSPVASTHPTEESSTDHDQIAQSMEHFSEQAGSSLNRALEDYSEPHRSSRSYEVPPSDPPPPYSEDSKADQANHHRLASLRSSLPPLSSQEETADISHNFLQDLREPSGASSESDREDALNDNPTQLSRGRSSQVRGTPGLDVKVPPQTAHFAAKHAPASAERFSLLPDGKRPEPAGSSSHEPELEDTWSFCRPEPLQPPSIERRIFNIPRATLVPSYVLASSNRFASAEVASSLNSMMTPPPLFVCGRFMFPSILSAQARKSLSSVYSPIHRRRLHPNSADWAHIDRSIKHAAEAMTPAVLQGYYRCCRPQGMSYAALQGIKPNKVVEIDDQGNAVQDANPGAVSGFLIFNLQEEALRYCDLLLACGRNTLLELDRLQKWDRPDDAENQQSLPQLVQCFRREFVNVEIDLKDVGKRTLKAVTYVWNENALKLVGNLWEPERFVRTPSFRHWSATDTDWIQEEELLAKTLQITYVWHGDELADAALRHDKEHCEDLLWDRVDPSAACHIYGCPLQAAVAAGDVEIAQLLLQEGASASTRGGKYFTALVAASVQGRVDMVKLLLHHKADVNAQAGRYVNALYQAVNQSHAEMAFVLLEYGAWVNTKDYLELFDLAAEHQDRDMEELLIAYDVKQLHKSLPIFTRPSVFDRLHGASPKDKDNRKIAKQSNGRIAIAAFGEIAKQRGQEGKWTGIKGVNVLKTAIDAGLPADLVDKIAPYLTPISSFITYLESALREITHNRSGSFKIPSIKRSKSVDGESSDDDSTVDSDEEAKRRDEKRAGLFAGPSALRRSKSDSGHHGSRSRYDPGFVYRSNSNQPTSSLSPQFLQVPNAGARAPPLHFHQRSQSTHEFDGREKERSRSRASSVSTPQANRGALCAYCKGAGWFQEPKSRRNNRAFEVECGRCSGTGFNKN